MNLFYSINQARWPLAAVALLGLLCLGHRSHAQTYNSGTASNSGTLYHSGGFTNAGTFASTGTSSVSYAGTGTAFTNTGSYTGSGAATDQFIGPAGAAGSQELAGTVAATFYNLVLANGSTSAFAVTNSHGLRVSNLLTLSNGLTTTLRTAASRGKSVVQLLAGATISGTISDTRFIDGYASQVGGAANGGSCVLPVGASGASQPLTITTALSSATDTVSTAYFASDASTTTNPSDNALHPRTSTGPGLFAVSPVGYWDWSRSAAGTAPLSVSVALPAGLSIPASRLRLAGWNASTARWENLSGATVIASNARGTTLTGTVPAGFTALALGDQSVITVAAVVLLQGAYNSGTFLHKTTLNSRGILGTNATSQPYSAAPFSYAGTESETAAFFTANPNVVDWILVDLRDPTTPTTIVATQAALLLANGQVVDLDGTSAVSFTQKNIAPGTYHIGIRHRNSLAIRTANAKVQTFDGVNPVPYDFTTSQDQAYQDTNNMTNAAMVAVAGSGGTTRYALYGGNVNGNSNVRFASSGNDTGALLNGCLGGDQTLSLNPAYSSCDLNFDGIVRYSSSGNDTNFLLNTVLGGDQTLTFQQHL